MKVDEILGTRTPLEAAREIVRRGFDRESGFGSLATRWLKLVEIQGISDDASASPIGWTKDTCDAVRTVLIAAEGHHGALVREVLEQRDRLGSDELRLAVLLATREDRREAIRLWSHTVHFPHLTRFVRMVADDLPFCTQLLGPPIRRPCECRQHEVDVLLAWVAVLLERRRHGVSYDLGLIPGEGIPIESWLDEGRLDLARVMRTEGCAPEGLDALAREQLADHRWGRAVRWLAGSSAERAACVDVLIAHVRAAPDVRVPLAAVAGTQLERLTSGGTFVGHGWGREHRAKLLQPLSNLLLDRAVWPSAELRELVAPPPSDLEAQDAKSEYPQESRARRDAEAQEQTWTHVRELLAEGLLAIALDLDARREQAVRLRAVRALGELRPRGDGSWTRALSKLKGGPLGTAAREAQVAMKEPAADAELAIGDALAVFFVRDPRG